MQNDADLPFSRVNLEQGTDAWRAWRRGGIGASDAPTIMGENRWKSADTLRREFEAPANSTGTSTTSRRRLTPAMARGNALEPEARLAYNKLNGLNVQPACLQSNSRDWMRCSADGICFEKSTAVEIKCGVATYKSTAQRRQVPRHYYGQIQHTLAVTGFGAMDFFCYLPAQRPIFLNCPRDEEYINRLIEREELFWNSLNRG